MRLFVFLVENGAEKDQTDAFGRTIVQLATDHGHLEVTRFLVEAGADKSWLVTHGALHAAAQNGQLEMVRFLVEVGCGKEQTDLEMTPLMAAARNGHLDVVRVLVKSGACCHSTDQTGSTAVDPASEFGHAEVVRFLSDLAESPQKVRRVNSSGSDLFSLPSMSISLIDIEGKEKRSEPKHGKTFVGFAQPKKALASAPATDGLFACLRCPSSTS